MKYLKSKSGSLENSILSVWSEAAKKEGNAFGQAVMSAKEKGDKSFVFAGKKYDVEESLKKMKETNKNDKSDDGEGMDAVQPKAVKKKFKDRKDKDIDNDGDVDSSDKYLHKRRKAISKAIKSEDYLDEKNKIGSKQVDFELFSDEKGAKAANMAMNKEIRRASQMKDYKSARAYMDKIQAKYSELGAEDSEPQRTIDAILGAVFKEAMKSEDLAKDDEKSVGKVIKGLKKAVKIHQGQVDSLTKDIKDSYEYGTKEATENSLNITPGQSTDDWNKQVGIMQEKQTSMREAIAKMWGVEEGHNPFKKEEVKTSKKEGKTMTGKSETKVTIGMKEK